MKNREEIKTERNQGEKMRGQRDTGKTLNEKEMELWDKEVRKSKRRYHSSKEIKDHLHFAFSSAFAVIIFHWRQTPAPHSKWHQSEWVILTNWAAWKKTVLFWRRRGLQTVGSLWQDKDITVIGRYTLLPLISDRRRKWRLEKMGQRARTDCSNRKKMQPRISVMSQMLCTCIRTIWEIHP